MAVAVLASIARPGLAELTERWSFDGAPGSIESGSEVIASVGSSSAVLRGEGAVYNRSALVLPGSTNGARPVDGISAYLDLPNGIISSKTDLTIEIWATALSPTSWARVFDFGRAVSAGDGSGAPGEWTGTSSIVTPEGEMASDNLMLSFSRGISLNEQLLAMRLNAANDVGVESFLRTTIGQTYHYVCTFREGAGVFGGSGGQMAWYRDGVLIGSRDVPFRLREIEDVNNWLGRSNWSSDSGTHAAYDELRLYDHAFIAEEVLASRDAGPDQPLSQPAANPDAVTMHRAQKAWIPVLANDDGWYRAGTVEVLQPPQFGTATEVSSGAVLYAHTTSGPTTDSFTYRVTNSAGTEPPSAPTTVTIHFADTLRVPNGAMNVPLSPPVDAIQLVEGLPGVGFHRPISMTSRPGDPRRLFVSEQLGTIKVIPDVTAAVLTSSTFIDLRAMVEARGLGETIDTAGSDQGLLGLAFHPRYEENGFFFVLYTVNKSGVYYHRLSRLSIRSDNPNTADPHSEYVLFDLIDDHPFHNAGDIHFGPDGYLYVPMGDEGLPNDGNLNSQRIDHDFYSAIMRLDVDKKMGNLEPNPHPALILDNGLARYAIPADNPFVGAVTFNGVPVDPTKVRTEFWAVGLRNPYRISFDPLTGELWCADVGEASAEEVNIITRGGNYGWAFREGFGVGVRHPAPDGFAAIDPVYAYSRIGSTGDADFTGNSITGGLIYRGARFPSLAGAYIFSDAISGHIWALRRDGAQIGVERIAGQSFVVGFGRDPSNGDVLLVDYFGGRILRLVVGAAEHSFPATLSSTRLFADLTDLAPNPGLLPYEPNLPFWSDHAVKRRWLSVPDAHGLTWSRNRVWNFPTGTVAVKHFDLELTRGDPSTKKRLETRVLVKNDTGSFGVSYRWNEQQTEAHLVPDGGDQFDVNVVENGQPRVQTWQIPSRADCRTCHTANAGHFLSLNTRQLNQAHTMNGFSGNQIELLHHAGYFTNTPESSNTLPRHLRANESVFPLEARVRSALAVNCAYCHTAGGAPSPSWDGDPALALAHTRMVNGTASNNGGDPMNKLIVPGNVDRSIIYNRTAAANGFTRMPPLASNELDATTIALLRQWIEDELPSRQDYAAWRVAQFGASDSPEGDSSADADGDGRTNYEEYVAGTDPQDGAGGLPTPFLINDNTVRLAFELPPHRSYQVETSNDLVTWNLWDVPGNQGLPSAGGAIELNAPAAAANGDNQFFRVRIWEN